jgi:hypothetical protein
VLPEMALAAGIVCQVALLAGMAALAWFLWQWNLIGLAVAEPYPHSPSKKVSGPDARDRTLMHGIEGALIGRRVHYLDHEPGLRPRRRLSPHGRVHRLGVS